MQPIYLDYNATTPLDPAVSDAMTPYLQRYFGNPFCTPASLPAFVDLVSEGGLARYNGG